LHLPGSRRNNTWKLFHTTAIFGISRAQGRQKFVQYGTMHNPEFSPLAAPANCLANANAKPEWLRIPEVARLFGIRRSMLYELITSGKVKSCSLRRRGAMRGIRLISYDSLVAYLESQVKAE
jgi:hypothetical protein